MSDQPHWDHNLERQIPGLREALANLSAIAERAGFRVATIAFVPNHRPERDGEPPTRITIAPTVDQPSTLATTAAPGEPWAPAHSTTQIPYRQELQPPAQRGAQIRHRPKRASTSLIDDESESGPQGGKRKRLSDPLRSATGGPSGAFWGTVLEDRPEGTQGNSPIQRSPIAPPQAGPSYLREQSPRPRGDELLGRAPIDVSTEQTAEGQVHRASTLPSLRLRSPLPQHRRSALPSLRESLAEAPGRIFRERHPSEPSQPGRPALPERRFLRSASQLFGRFSPFGASGQGATRAQAAPPPLSTEAPYQVGGTPVLPALHGAGVQQAPEMFSQAGTADTLHAQVFPAMRSPMDPPGLFAAQYGTNVTQHSGSRSASGSGVSHAQPSRTTSSPAEGGRGSQIATTGRGKRGRRGGSSADREQFFECEQCNSKFRRKSDKNRHVRVVHEKSRPFVCPICQKTFGEKSNMLKHRASVHDDVRIFRCPYCDLSFSQRGMCDNHVKTVHDRKQAKYFCEHCGLPFSRKIHLNEHYERLHPEYMSAYGHFQAGASSATPGAGARNTTGAQTAGPEDRAMVGDTMHSVPSQEPTAVLGAYGGPAPGTTTPRGSLPYPVPQLGARGEYEQTEEGGGRNRRFHGDSPG